MSALPDMDALDRLMTAGPVIPVLTIEDAGQAVPLAETLASAGLGVLEITLRTKQALTAIRRIADEVPGAVVGAGTVVGADDLDRVRQAGGRFAIAPGATPALYEHAAAIEMPFLPGVATASEILAGLEVGWRRFKLFPAAASGGIPLLKSFHGPFPEVRFCPTGGIGPDDFTDYLALPNVPCVGGSWMVPADRLAASDWPAIAQRARDCLQAAPD